MLTAVERDLGLTAGAAQQRFDTEFAASQTLEQLASDLADGYAGGWVTDDQQLVVAVTDDASAEQVRAAGGEPQLVSHSEAELNSVMADLDAAPTPDADEVYGWHVEVTSNQVVVQAAPDAVAEATAWAEEAGVDAVTVEPTEEAPEPLYDVIGGDAYYPGASRCSVGFSVAPAGFVTAGHCGGVGTSTSGFNNAAQGTVQGSSFPGNDYGWVSVNSNWSTQPLVNQYNGSAVTVAGGQAAGVGSAVCRSGSTTGWHCGEITHLNQTVNYAEGTVTGLTRTTACAEPGDSGGSWLAGSQAQGVTSGGSGNCSTGGVTFFQPLQPILSAYGLSLVTS
ncbi:S1 family peptidase [Natronosporangium hydrolyticum]|uniref:S1 family peptidase n=2 Tax=Natronosporangium hydrolyticum TaxID=2811111 RepID=A0A895YNQ8_9ACTN|nr:S1 family peptidase [Natronosporangium hydrolyticum]